MSKHESMLRLESMLSELYDVCYQGADTNRVARIQGLVDGYMRALTDFEVVEERELLDFVRHQHQSAMRRADAKFSGLQTAPNFA